MEAGEQWGDLATLQARANVGGGKEASDSGYILRVVLMGLAGGLAEVRAERERSGMTLRFLA